MDTLQTPKLAWQDKIYPLFTIMGWALVGFSFLFGAFFLSTTAASYWGGNAKAVRDAAEAGSLLLGQLQLLATTPRWLEPLIFLGVGSFIFGIALEFSTIPKLLKNRGEVMKACIPIIAKSGNTSA